MEINAKRRGKNKERAQCRHVIRSRGKEDSSAIGGVLEFSEQEANAEDH